MTTPPEPTAFPAHEEWLQRRWQISADTLPTVRRLLEAEKTGHTAIALENPGELSLPTSEPAVCPIVTTVWQGATFWQSARAHAAEATIARQLWHLASHSSPLALPAETAQELFPGQAPDDPQLLAARLAWNRRLALITGGPGTGKTYTLARILLGLARGGIPGEVISLLAPTGKAADRMREAILAALSTLPASWAAESAEVRHAASQAGTVHRWLLRRSPPPAEQPDVVLLDECSMLDLHPWAEILQDFPLRRRLILVGDPQQLESVGQGAVFAALTAEASRKDSPLHACRVHLQTVHRLQNRPAIAKLVTAVQNNQPVAALELLGDGKKDQDAELHWVELQGSLPNPQLWPRSIQALWQSLAQAPTAKEALHTLRQLGLLTAHREGPFGARPLNTSISLWLARQGTVGFRPILIGRNDPETGLRNGSLGVARGAEAWFLNAEGEPKKFPLGQLPEFSEAWAITIHKAQGSEYEHVAVVLPHAESPLLARALLYTALTRARSQLTLLASREALTQAIATANLRTTLLPKHWHDLELRNSL